jgi:hypothetical protein
MRHIGIVLVHIVRTSSQFKHTCSLLIVAYFWKHIYSPMYVNIESSRVVHPFYTSSIFHLHIQDLRGQTPFVKVGCYDDLNHVSNIHINYHVLLYTTLLVVNRCYDAINAMNAYIWWCNTCNAWHACTMNIDIIVPCSEHTLNSMRYGFQTSTFKSGKQTFHCISRP